MGARVDESLLAAVFAEPDCVAHRQVYADWLSEHGDPRGEFINLQLAEHAGQGSVRGRERARMLQKAHQKSWLGPLVRIFDRNSVEFERGFPTRARCKPGLRKSQHQLGTSAWATFEHLEDPPLALVHDSATTSLRSISVHRAQAQLLLERDRLVTKLRALEVRARRGIGDVILGEERELYEHATCLPSLELLSMVYFQTSGQPWTWIWRGALGRSLKRLAVRCTDRWRGGPAGLWAQQLREDEAALSCVVVSDRFLDVTLGHVREFDWAQARVSRAQGRGWDPEQIRAELETLALRGITHLMVEREIMASDRPDIREVLGRFEEITVDEIASYARRPRWSDWRSSS